YSTFSTPPTALASPSAPRTSSAYDSWPLRLRRRTSAAPHPRRISSSPPALQTRRPSRMDRELLLEIGCEEIPASWLPALTQQVGDVLSAELHARRLPPEAPVETYSTPRRLTARIGRIAERQSDFEELVNGPPVSAAFGPDGTPTKAAT